MVKTLHITLALHLYTATAARADATPPISEEDIRTALRRYEHEPTAIQVIEAALKNPTIDPTQIARAASRARAAGWLPDVQVRARRGRGQNLYAYQSTNSDRTNLSDDMYIEGSLTFRLDRLLASGMEVGLFREERNHWVARRELIHSIVRLYFERRRLQLQRDLFGTLSVSETLRIQEIETELEIFTNGRFGRMMSPTHTE